ncbi:Hypothetical_protein [Hexamita inflata]|uniref:Hypothetical_protein n=1 Tax=Hexamita inflata TaxID=28002 RepID=A0AA86PVK5_9EUKA|nr:Hypothetical protein HINF_LOCUS32592 [Hexamita inflata]
MAFVNLEPGVLSYTCYMPLDASKITVYSNFQSILNVRVQQKEILPQNFTLQSFDSVQLKLSQNKLNLIILDSAHERFTIILVRADTKLIRHYQSLQQHLSLQNLNLQVDLKRLEQFITQFTYLSFSKQQFRFDLKMKNLIQDIFRSFGVAHNTPIIQVVYNSIKQQLQQQQRVYFADDLQKKVNPFWAKINSLFLQNQTVESFVNVGQPIQRITSKTDEELCQFDNKILFCQMFCLIDCINVVQNRFISQMSNGMHLKGEQIVQILFYYLGGNENINKLVQSMNYKDLRVNITKIQEFAQYSTFQKQILELSKKIPFTVPTHVQILNKIMGKPNSVQNMLTFLMPLQNGGNLQQLYIIRAMCQNRIKQTDFLYGSYKEFTSVYFKSTDALKVILCKQIIEKFKTPFFNTEQFAFYLFTTEFSEFSVFDFEKQFIQQIQTELNNKYYKFIQNTFELKIIKIQKAMKALINYNKEKQKLQATKLLQENIRAQRGTEKTQSANKQQKDNKQQEVNIPIQEWKYNGLNFKMVKGQTPPQQERKQQEFLSFDEEDQNDLDPQNEQLYTENAFNNQNAKNDQVLVNDFYQFVKQNSPNLIAESLIKTKNEAQKLLDTIGGEVSDDYDFEENNNLEQNPIQEEQMDIIQKLINSGNNEPDQELEQKQEENETNSDESNEILETKEEREDIKQIYEIINSVEAEDEHKQEIYQLLNSQIDENTYQSAQVVNDTYNTNQTFSIQSQLTLNAFKMSENDILNHNNSHQTTSLRLPNQVQLNQVESVKQSNILSTSQSNFQRRVVISQSILTKDSPVITQNSTNTSPTLQLAPNSSQSNTQQINIQQELQQQQNVKSQYEYVKQEQQQNKDEQLIQDFSMAKTIVIESVNSSPLKTNLKLNQQAIEHLNTLNDNLQISFVDEPEVETPFQNEMKLQLLSINDSITQELIESVLYIQRYYKNKIFAKLVTLAIRAEKTLELKHQVKLDREQRIHVIFNKQQFMDMQQTIVQVKTNFFKYVIAGMLIKYRYLQNNICKFLKIESCNVKKVYKATKCIQFYYRQNQIKQQIKNIKTNSQNKVEYQFNKQITPSVTKIQFMYKQLKLTERVECYAMIFKLLNYDDISFKLFLNHYKVANNKIQLYNTKPFTQHVLTIKNHILQHNRQKIINDFNMTEYLNLYQPMFTTQKLRSIVKGAKTIQAQIRVLISRKSRCLVINNPIISQFVNVTNLYQRFSVMKKILRLITLSTLCIQNKTRCNNNRKLLSTTNKQQIIALQPNILVFDYRHLKSIVSAVQVIQKLSKITLTQMNDPEPEQFLFKKQRTQFKQRRNAAFTIQTFYRFKFLTNKYMSFHSRYAKDFIYLQKIIPTQYMMSQKQIKYLQNVLVIQRHVRELFGRKVLFSQSMSDNKLIRHTELICTSEAPEKHFRSIEYIQQNFSKQIVSQHLVQCVIRAYIKRGVVSRQTVDITCQLLGKILSQSIGQQIVYDLTENTQFGVSNLIQALVENLQKVSFGEAQLLKYIAALSRGTLFTKEQIQALNDFYKENKSRLNADVKEQLKRALAAIRGQ